MKRGRKYRLAGRQTDDELVSYLAAIKHFLARQGIDLDRVLESGPGERESHAALVLNQQAVTFSYQWCEGPSRGRRGGTAQRFYCAVHHLNGAAPSTSEPSYLQKKALPATFPAVHGCRGGCLGSND